MTFKDLVQSRRSIRVFENDANWDSDAVKRSIDLAILSPNSSNMQLWEFHRIVSKDALKKVVWTCMGQSAAKTAQELVVLVSRIDKYKERAAYNLAQASAVDSRGMKRAKEYYGKQMPLFYRTDILGISSFIRFAAMAFTRLKKPFMWFWSEAQLHSILHKTNGIASQTFMLAMKAEGYDTCPMEGFDEPRLKKILGLPAKAQISMVLACGKSAPDGVYAQRWRVPHEDVVVVH